MAKVQQLKCNAIQSLIIAQCVGTWSKDFQEIKIKALYAFLNLFKMHFKQKEVELMILNKLYKNIETFLESLERKLKLILGEGWIIQTHRQEKAV